MDEVRYYNSPITLEEAERYIQGGLITAARAYVANGYYLRRIRDDKLFEEAGYQNFEDYVRGKYNKDKGWASKCIKVNQQLSEGGNSPILSNQYLEYSTYQLVELAYMTEEQREEADPDMTVNQLKQIRKPEEAIEPEKSCDVTTSEPEEEIEPEQINDGSIPCDSCQHELGMDGGNDCEICSDYESFEQKQESEEVSEPDYPGFYNSDDEKEVDESYSLAGVPRASDRHVTMLAQLFVRENAKRLIYGGGFIGINDEEIIDMLRIFQRTHHPIVIDSDVEVSVAAEIIEFFKGDEDLGICLFKKFTNFARKQIDEYIDQMVKNQAGKLEKSQGSGTFNSEPTGCPHREEYSCTLSEENKSVPGDGNNCGFSCCWSCKFHGACELECNASAGRDGTIPEYNAAWAVKTWATQYPKRLDAVLRVCRDEKSNSDRAKAVQMYLAPAGYSQYLRKGNSFRYSSFGYGMDFRIGKVDIHLKYGRFVQELLNRYPDFVVPEAGEYETVIEEHETVQEQAESVPESPETVIDGEFVEVPPEPEITEYTPQYFLEEQKEKLDKYLRVMERAEMKPADVKFLECQKTIVAALACMVAELERPEPEPESVKREQPELPILKNNDQRKEFIENYAAWPLWIEIKETGERYYRYDLSEKVAMVVKVSWKRAWLDYKTFKGYEYGAEHYYLLGVGTEWKSGKNVYTEDDTRSFYECSSNMSALVEYLKEFQKKK